MFDSFGKRSQTRPNLQISLNSPQQSALLHDSSFFTQKASPSVFTRKPHLRDLSLRSFSNNRKQTFFKIPQRNPAKRENQESQSSQLKTYHYHQIERVLQKQNCNLRQQNYLLLAEIKRLKNGNKKYKEICYEQQTEIEHLTEEREVHKKRADQMKDIIMKELKALQARALREVNQSVLQSAFSIVSSLSSSQNRVQK